MKVLLSPLFYLVWRIKVEGREHIPATGPFILAPNHDAFLDSMFLPLVVRRRVTFVAKAEYFDSWKTASFFRAGGQIPMRREGRERLGAGPGPRRGTCSRAGSWGSTPRDPLTRRPDCTTVTPVWPGWPSDAASRSSPSGWSGTSEIQPPGSNGPRPFKSVTIRFGPPMQMDPPENPADPLENHDHTQCRRSSPTA